MFGAALSEHPVAAHATGEVVGSLLEQVGEEPDAVFVFATGAHVGAFEDVVSAVHATMRPRALLGATAVSVIGGAREVEEQPALALWAGAAAGARARWFAAGDRGGGSWSFTGPSDDELAAASTLVLLADPTSFPATPWLEHLGERHPHLRVVGGMASSGFAPGANRVCVDGAVRSSGAAGLLLGPESEVTTVVSQGCRPIGDPLTVTRAERNVLYELAGRPALERLEEVLSALSPDELAMARQGLHLGRVIDEHKVDFERGDFLVRNVLGADRDVGAVAVGDRVEIGDTVQFQVRDRRSADEDLRLLLDGHEARSALVFTCNGRGVRLFGGPDHDARVVAQSIDSRAVAGMFCAGEIGPVGDRCFVHGFTASVLLFGGACTGGN